MKFIYFFLYLTVVVSAIAASDDRDLFVFQTLRQSRVHHEQGVVSDVIRETQGRKPEYGRVRMKSNSDAPLRFRVKNTDLLGQEGYPLTITLLYGGSTGEGEDACLRQLSVKLNTFLTDDLDFSLPRKLWVQYVDRPNDQARLLELCGVGTTKRGKPNLRSEFLGKWLPRIDRLVTRETVTKLGVIRKKEKLKKPVAGVKPCLLALDTLEGNEQGIWVGLLKHTLLGHLQKRDRELQGTDLARYLVPLPFNPDSLVKNVREYIGIQYTGITCVLLNITPREETSEEGALNTPNPQSRDLDYLQASFSVHTDEEYRQKVEASFTNVVNPGKTQGWGACFFSWCR